MRIFNTRKWAEVPAISLELESCTYSYRQSAGCISKYLLTLVRPWGQLQFVSDGGGGPTHHRHCLVLPRGHALHPGQQASLPEPGDHQSLLLIFRPRPGYQENPAVRDELEICLNLVNILTILNQCIILCRDLINVCTYPTYPTYTYLLWIYTWVVFSSITDQIPGTVLCRLISCCRYD